MLEPATEELPGDAVPAVDADGAPDDDAARVGYELVVPDEPNGPVVRSLLRRAGLAAAVVGGVSLGALALAKKPKTKATLLGVMVPGGGYAYSANPLRMAGTLGAFGLSLAAWWGTGNVLVPPAIWAGAALDARRKTGRGRNWERSTTVVPLALGAAAVVGTVARRRAFRQAQARGRIRAEYLRVAPRIKIPTSPPPVEMTEDDVATMRSFLDRALQPHDDFDGYDVIEQFQTAAIRYQIFMMDWTLALSQMTRTPAFRGYVSAAQRALIAKVTHKRVWGYWKWEQTWGNLSLDWDPMVRDNIMLSGYLGTMLGFYESNTGDPRFREPGSLPFALGKRRWDYDSDMVAAAVADNMARSKLTLFPCEPNWIYSGCNMAGINTLLLSDRLAGTAHLDSVGDDFRRRFRDEFFTPDGRITAIRSARLGVTIPMLTSALADAGATTLAHAIDPDLAQRTWTIVRNEFVDTSGPEVKITLRGWDAIDVGNYQRSDVTAFAAVMWAAAEMGDSDLYEQLMNRVDAHFDATVTDGRRWYGGASTQANSMFGMARFSQAGSYRRMIQEGPGRAVLDGPYLEGADYPEVLVAFADTDGDDLRLVLRPGRDDGGRQRLGIEQLAPGRKYRVTGATTRELTADGDGRATVEVDLVGRCEVALVPGP